MATAPLSGPRAAPASGGPPKQLVVFLHGVGADGNDLIALAPYYAELMPEAEFLAPHAPFAFDMAPAGRQWFSLNDPSQQNILAGIQAAAPALNAFLDKELADRGLSDDKLALVGFSQGTMMALYVALRRPRACAALVGYSGLLAAPEGLPAEITARPPCLLIHGEQDEVVPYGFLALAKSALEVVGVPVLSLSCPGLGHAIDDEGLVAGIRFAAQCFGLPEATGGA